jgi:aryl-alcohol dehydrogenase-like predicted oxidoreductase
LIRAAGLWNHGILQLEDAEQIGTVDAIQPPFNLIHRDAADDVLPWAREREAGAIVYSPMASGLLTRVHRGAGDRPCSPRQVDGWLPAATLEPKDGDLTEIAAAIRATGAGTGPASPSPA